MDSKLIGEIKSLEVAEQTVVKTHELLERWTEFTISERQEFLGAYIRLNIAKAIGISPCELDMQQSIKYLGIDSLIAVKLRNKLRNDLEVDLAAVKFLEDISLGNLVIQVHEQIENAKSNPYTSCLELQNHKENLNSTAINDDDWLEGEI